MHILDAITVRHAAACGLSQISLEMIFSYEESRNLARSYAMQAAFTIMVLENTSILVAPDLDLIIVERADWSNPEGPW